MTEDIYAHLAGFLDLLPGGFPATESGVELRILRRLFTPAQAELALHLSLIAETPSVIALRANKPIDEVADLLEEMERRGLVYTVHEKGEVPRYQAAPFVVGFYEFQVNKLDEEIAVDFREYLPHAFQPEIWRQAPLLRTIPIGESLTPELEIVPHEVAAELIEAHTKFSVAPCICRQEAEILGEGCGKPMEVCLAFGSGADFYVRNHMGRYITQEQALAIISLAEEAGLVLQPSASKEAAFICCCCGCCYGVLTNLRRHPKPAEVAFAPFLAVHDDELCVGCETCLERCQMDATPPKTASFKSMPTVASAAVYVSLPARTTRLSSCVERRVKSVVCPEPGSTPTSAWPRRAACSATARSRICSFNRRGIACWRRTAHSVTSPSLAAMTALPKE